MKNKLIATLVAATLQFHAAAALAQQAGGQCELANGAATGANGSTVTHSGPMNPVDGFPEYLTDSNGNSVQRCLDAAVCFLDPIDPADPFSLQINSGGESFWWSADAVISDPVSGRPVLKLVLAAEAAIMQTDTAGMLVNGSQAAFLRKRFVMGVPVDGTYTVKHPYGVDVFTVTGATGARDVFSTVDTGFAPNSNFTGMVGPFLVADTRPAGFLGDVNVPSTVTGSPCGRNFVEVSGVDTLGQPVVFGGGATVLRSDSFAVQGHTYDSRVQTPISAKRMTYSRSADGTGQIETFVQSSATAAVTANDGPTTPASAMRYHGVTALDHAAVPVGGSIDSLALPVVDAATLPPVVQLSASDALTDTSTLNLRMVDFVNIDYAEYDPETTTLTVSAHSGDQLGAPKLSLRDFGDFAAGSSVLELQLAAPPATVHVDSAGGGSDALQVQVLAPGAISAPLNLTFGATTSQSMVVSWLDTTRSETGFKVYVTPADGSRVLAATTGANITTATLTGLQAATSYAVEVEAYSPNAVATSAPGTHSTLALPAAPTNVAAVLASAQRTINVSWASSADATGYQVYRRDGAAGAFNLISGATPLAASQLSFTDSNAQVGTNTTYQVVTVRNSLGTVESSQPAYASELVTPAMPTAATSLSASLSAQTATLSWVASGDSAQQVYRQKDGGAFVAVGAALSASTTSFTDSNLAGGTYTYRVDATNWAGTSASTASSSISVVTLAAATSAAASTANQPVVTWIDNSIGESGYQIRRRAYSVDATTGIATAGNWSTLTAAAAVAGSGSRGTFTDATAVANTTYMYEVAPLNGAVVGTAATTGYTLALTGGLTRMSGFGTVTASVVGTAGRVVLTWAASTNPSVAGYEITRCNSLVLPLVGATAVCTNTAVKLGSAANSGGTVDGRNTVTFTDTTVARNTSYVYNIRLLGAAGTGISGQQLLLGKTASVR